MKCTQMKKIMMEKLKIYKMKFFIDINFTRLKKRN